MGSVGFSTGQEVQITRYATHSVVSATQEHRFDLSNCIDLDFLVALRSPVALIFTGLWSLTAVYRKLSA